MMDADLTTHHIEGIARMGNKPFRVDLFSQIDRNLWTGGCPVEKAPAHFRFIVCLYPGAAYQVNQDQVLTIANLFDSHEVPDAELLKCLADHVNRCALVGPILVHCQAGLNRSALVAALALTRRSDHMSAREAIALLRQKRGEAVLCNETFEKWLLAQDSPAEVFKR